MRKVGAECESIPAQVRERGGKSDLLKGGTAEEGIGVNRLKAGRQADGREVFAEVKRVAHQMGHGVGQHDRTQGRVLVECPHTDGLDPGTADFVRHGEFRRRPQVAEQGAGRFVEFELFQRGKRCRRRAQHAA